MLDKKDFLDIYIAEASKYSMTLDDDFLATLLKKNNINYGDFLLTFPAGQKDVITLITERWNDEVLRLYDGNELRFSEKITLLLKLKVKIALENETLFTNLYSMCLLPKYIDVSYKITHLDVNFILDIAGDKSLDFSYYTKRLSLGAVYTSTMFVAYRTQNIDKTGHFIDKRIKNIIDFTKAKNGFFNNLKKCFT